MTLQAQIAAVAQGLKDLRAEIEQPKKDEEKPVEADETQDEDKPVETEDKPAEAEDKPDEGKPAETVSEDAPAEESTENEDADDEKDDDEVKPGVAQQKALKKRVNAMQKKLAALERQLASMAQDPSFAAAAMQPSDIEASDSASDGTMTREQANAAYAKLTNAREKAEFRKAHAKELGL